MLRNKKIHLYIILSVVCVFFGYLMVERWNVPEHKSNIALQALDKSHFVTRYHNSSDWIDILLVKKPANKSDFTPFYVTITQNDLKKFEKLTTITNSTEKNSTTATTSLNYSWTVENARHISEWTPISTFFSKNWFHLLFVAFIIMSAASMFKQLKTVQGGKMFGLGGDDLGVGKAISTLTFQDVAGMIEEKEECLEIVDYLKNGKKYLAVGARTPKGILLAGPPGTGKTLLAKAIAGEAKVPFLAISGSEVEEVFVGLGAKRLRTLFQDAKKKAPCIVFIDEIDSIGRSRGQFGSSVGDQTLNQLLTEMDGFSSNQNIVVIAATNLEKSLDSALTRPGRFDRIIKISLPTVKEREEILRLHARNKNVSVAVNFTRLAERTPGFSGAQLENVLNEAAILSVRKNNKTITLIDLDEAIDRVVAGPAKTSKIISPKEKKIVAFHESGHALIGLRLESASKVQKITIVPRGDAGGYTISIPKEESFYIPKSELLSMITGLLGGRAAEEIMFGASEVTTGSHNDLEKATTIAKRMIANFGMSDSLGLASTDLNNQQGFFTKSSSEEYYSKLDVEIKKILHNCYEHAKKLINENMNLLALLAESLLLLETINAEQIEYISKNLALPTEAIEVKNKLNEIINEPVGDIDEKN